MKHDTTKNNTQIFVLPAQVPLLSRAGWARLFVRVAGGWCAGARAEPISA